MTLLSQLMGGDICAVPLLPDTTGIEFEDCEMKLRICGGKLQVCDCGTWIDVPSCDGDGGGFEPTQPGGGTDTPKPGGGTAQYCGAMAGNQKWYLPVTVSTGDVLLFSRLQGAANDSRELFWHCPDGWLFVEGGCFENIQYNETGDLLPGTRHMELVANIGGTYYDVLNVDGQGLPQPFTVPSGIDHAPVTLAFNDDYTVPIYGEVSFCVDVTNNQLASWEIHETLETQPGKWTTDIAGVSGTQSVWVLGDGWNSVDCDNLLGGSGRYNVVFLHRVFSSAIHLKHFEMTFDAVVGDLADSGHQLVNVKQGATDNSVISTVPVTANGQILAADFDLSGVTEIIVLLYGSDHNDTTCPPTGSARLYDVRLRGVGPEPI
jgi:hypothetical protein